MIDSPRHDILLTFIHISDSHLSGDPAYTFQHANFPPLAGARALVKRINDLPFTPDFILHTGDVVYDPDPDPASYALAREVFRTLKYPVHYLVGNHDESEMLQRILLDKTPVTPFDYEFEINGVQIVCVDSNRPAKLPRGRVSDEQLDWLRRVCRPADPRPLIVAVHHNPLAVGIPWWDDFMRLENGDDFHAALLPARDRLRGVFFGHVHQNTETYRDGILYSSVVSSWYQIFTMPGQTETIYDREGQPGFNIVTLTRDRTFIRRCTFTVEGS